MDSYRFHVRKNKNDEVLIAYNYETSMQVEGKDKQGLIKNIRDKLGKGRCLIRRNKLVYSTMIIPSKKT